MFPYINDTIHEIWNTEWIEKNDKLKEIESYTRPWKENNRCRMDATVINRLRAGHTLLAQEYLMEGLPMPECELCHSRAMTVKHLLTDCANLASFRLRFFMASTQTRWKNS